MKKVRRWVLRDEMLSLPTNSPLLHAGERLNVIFIGKTGVGKSATANTLVGRELFAESSMATSREQSIEVKEVDIGHQQFRYILKSYPMTMAAITR